MIKKHNFFRNLFKEFNNDPMMITRYAEINNITEEEVFEIVMKAYAYVPYLTEAQISTLYKDFLMYSTEVQERIMVANEFDNLTVFSSYLEKRAIKYQKERARKREYKKRWEEKKKRIIEELSSARKEDGFATLDLLELDSRLRSASEELAEELKYDGEI